MQNHKRHQSYFFYIILLQISGFLSLLTIYALPWKHYRLCIIPWLLLIVQKLLAIIQKSLLGVRENNQLRPIKVSLTIHWQIVICKSIFNNFKVL